jgi:hypothetical protein
MAPPWPTAAHVQRGSLENTCEPPHRATPDCNVIKAPWLVNGGHGASLRHHNEGSARTGSARTGSAAQASFLPTRFRPQNREQVWTHPS